MARGLHAVFCFSLETFAKVLERFNSLASMEEIYRFPLLRLKPFDAPPPPFVIPVFAGMRLFETLRFVVEFGVE